MKYAVTLGVIAIALAGFMYYALFKTPAHELASQADKAREELSQEEKVVAPTAEPRSGTGTLEALRLMGVSMECTISYYDDEQQTTVEGTYFVADGDMRGDFLTQSPDLTGQVLSSMIISGATMYMWSEIEGESYGMQMDLSQFKSDGVAAHEPVSLDAEVDYDCKPWVTVDRTVFDPPASVLFQDMNDLMRAGMEYGTVYEEMPTMPEF